MLESLPASRQRRLTEFFPGASAEALDLLRQCVQFNPMKRLSAKDALQHPYVIQFHNPEDEVDCEKAIQIPLDDNTKLKVEDYRDRLYNEVLRKKKEQRRSHRRNLEMQQQMEAQQQPQQAMQQGPSAAGAGQSGAVYAAPRSSAAGPAGGAVSGQHAYYGSSAQPQYYGSSAQPH